MEATPAASLLECSHTDCDHSSQFKNNHSTEMCSGSEAGSYLRPIDSCITQLKAQEPSRTCNESTEEEEVSTECWQVCMEAAPAALGR